mmetsp:Transcript_2427/g.5421  ORF Transcript_2427/g.5421 Transcript_2427/m.5421 type:complete len:82 (+) Transcript_2427:31-276(+)
MHPNLALHKHPVCEEAINQLHQCHAENAFLKWLGACNSVRRELDRCLTQEFLVRRELNQVAAAQEKERVKELLRARGVALD